MFFEAAIFCAGEDGIVENFSLKQALASPPDRSKQRIVSPNRHKLRNVKQQAERSKTVSMAEGL